MGAFVIGIGGGSGSGKSVIAEELRQRLAPLRLEVMNQDRYFHEASRLPRHSSRDGGREWPDHNRPESFDGDRLWEDVRRARNGNLDVLIVEGILVLYDERLRKLMDLKLFVDTDPDERIVRRIRRNLAKGYDLDGICDFYLDSVRYRHREFCQTTKAHADMVVPGGQEDRQRTEEVLEEVVRRVREAAVGAR
jgi:uridine kinase